LIDEPVNINILIYASMELRNRIMRFFSYVRIQFGSISCNLLKEFIKLTKQGIMLRIWIRFL